MADPACPRSKLFCVISVFSVAPQYLRMKAWILALAAGLLLALPASPALAINASDVAPCRPGMPQQLRTLKGLFTVHVVCDHVLYEIPLNMLDRDMLLNTEFAALSTGTEKLAPGAVVENRLVRWTRRGNKVYLEAVQYEMRAANMSNLQRGVEAASLRTVIKAFEAIAEGENGAPMIDVTGLYVTEVPEGFAQEFKTYFQMTAMDPKRSYIETVKAFPRNVEMRFFQTWTADPRALARSDEPGRSPIPASLGFVFHTSMLLLPEEPMIGRYSDPRVGYFDVTFDDYGTPEHRAVKRGFITRYRLEKKDPERQSRSRSSRSSSISARRCRRSGGPRSRRASKPGRRPSSRPASATRSSRATRRPRRRTPTGTRRTCATR